MADPWQRPEGMILQEISDKLEEIISKSCNIVLQVEGGGADGILSNPPSGCYKITNLYVNGEGKLVVEYDDG